ncbi:MAG: hypothetical protein R2849_02205 [Thermomicrobiales bacterium]
MSGSALPKYYLTSLIATLARSTEDPAAIETVELEETELLGVDDRHRLATAEAILRQRILFQHMAAGVTIVDPDRTVVERDVQIEADARIEPGCFLRGTTVIPERRDRRSVFGGRIVDNRM